MSSRSPFAPLVFLFQTALCQLIGVSILLLSLPIIGSSAIAVCAGAGVAFFVAHFLALSPPWQLLNVVILPASVALILAPLPWWVPAVLFALSVVIYAPAFWTRVPYYPTSRATYPLILAELPVDRPFTFIDIGCGFGDLLLFLSRHRPLGTFTGIEIGVLPFIAAWFRSLLFARGRVRIRFQSMWSLDLADYDTVYAFLSPAPMSNLWAKARDEMRRGSFFITNSFAVSEPATRTVTARDERESTLYIHEM